MQQIASWGEWGRKVFEALFIWMLVAMFSGGVIGSILSIGEGISAFMLFVAMPIGIWGFLIQAAFLWRKRPRKSKPMQASSSL